jgi:hypothetical protein
MKKTLLAAVATAGLMSSPAWADTICDLTEDNGSKVSYHFDQSWVEVEFAKNGSSQQTRQPWRTRTQGQFFVVTPAATPEWALVIDASNKVKLLHGPKEVAWGECSTIGGRRSVQPAIVTRPAPGAGALGSWRGSCCSGSRCAGSRCAGSRCAGYGTRSSCSGCGSCSCRRPS